MYYIYVLVSVSRNYIYVGMTDNLERRIMYHNAGYNKTTKAYRPFRVLLTEQFPSRIEAREREKYLKSGVGKESLKQILSRQNLVDANAQNLPAGRQVVCLRTCRFDSD